MHRSSTSSPRRTIPKTSATPRTSIAEAVRASRKRSRAPWSRPASDDLHQLRLRRALGGDARVVLGAAVGARAVVRVVRGVDDLLQLAPLAVAVLVAVH